MQWIQVVLWGIVLLGHLVLWVACFNRLHASGLAHRVNRLIEKFYMLMAAAGVAAWAWLSFIPLGQLPDFFETFRERIVVAAYVSVCLGVGGYVGGNWLWRRFFRGTPPPLVSNHTKRFDVAEQLGATPAGNWRTRVAAHLPGNQIFHLEVHEKTVAIDTLPRALDGMTITHLSDLHLSGKITRDYFDFVVDQANQFDSDLVAVPGDVVGRPSCLDWLPGTLGALQSRLGVYYILGNHERRLSDVERVRSTLNDLGLIDVSRRLARVEMNGQELLLAGNEEPWFGPPTEIDVEDRGPDQFRVLLSHSPDQIEWARARQFHLMLSGHTHGGQIRLPLIGPIVSPSKYGVRYASGIFLEPPTLMHVTRGISAMAPIRFNCPPELTQLVLREPARPAPAKSVLG